MAPSRGLSIPHRAVDDADEFLEEGPEDGGPEPRRALHDGLILLRHVFNHQERLQHGWQRLRLVWRRCSAACFAAGTRSGKATGAAVAAAPGAGDNLLADARSVVKRGHDVGEDGGGRAGVGDGTGAELSHPRYRPRRRVLSTTGQGIVI